MARKKQQQHSKNSKGILKGFVPDSQFDFHELGPLLPYDVEKILHEFLEDAYAAGDAQLLIITGKGQKVRPHVEKLLSQNKRVKTFAHAGYFNGQNGAFEVVLKV